MRRRPADHPTSGRPPGGPHGRPHPKPGTGLRRNLSVWQAVGISVALMAPSMAANINPQGTAGLVGRATPLAFFLAAVAVLLIAYVFVRLCQYYQHAGSVYVFAGATLGPRAGRDRRAGPARHLHVLRPGHRVARRASSARSSSTTIGDLDRPAELGRLRGRRARAARSCCGSRSCRRGAPRRRCSPSRASPCCSSWSSRSSCSSRWSAGTAPGDAQLDARRLQGRARHRRLDALPRHHLRPAVLRRLRGRGHPRRGGARTRAATSRARSSAPRSSAASTSPFVTAVEMMAFGTDDEGVAAFIALRRPDGRPRHVLHRVAGSATPSPSAPPSAPSPAAWPASSARSRLLFALARDAAPGSALGRTGRNDTPAVAAVVVTVLIALIALVCAVFFGADAVRHVPVERHDRHADPARRLRARDDRLHQAAVRRPQDGGAACGRS